MNQPRRVRKTSARVPLGPALLLILAAGLTAPAFSQSPPPGAQAPSFTLEGTISDLAPGKLTVSTQDNIIFTVLYTDKTQITRADGSPGSSKDFKRGLAVHVAGDLEESGDINAVEIHLLPPPGGSGNHKPAPRHLAGGHSLPLP